MNRVLFIVSFFILIRNGYAQLFVARDTISVIENAYSLKMPWAGGINFSNISNIDLNLDGKKDVVAFDRINLFNIGRFRCFVNTGVMLGGQTTYSANPELSYSFPATANWAIFRDYNCDGKEDLFCSTSAGIMVYKNASTTSLLNFTLVKSLLYSDFQGTTANLYAATNGVPGIVDIDGDGDLDVLTFSPLGSFIEYHKNLRVENGWSCDSLVFALATNCWGKISESNCTMSLNQTCSFKPLPDSQTIQTNDNSLHSGSCLTCLDSDGDGDQDLLMGDIGCSISQYAHNTGSTLTALMTDTTKLYPNFPNKGNTNQIKLNNFPCAYYVDIDGDNKNDLVATPNVTGSENTQSVWYYKNTSATSTVNFQFVKTNLFQDEMIEVGQNSFPVLFDYNADGKKDLLIGTYGYYVTNSLRAQLTLYQNIGTAAQPSYSLITRDYAGVLSYSLNNAIPTVGDIDGDGDVDILLATQSGQINWLKNLAGPGAVCNFTFLTNPFLLAVSPASMAVPAAAAPQLFDINKDGLLDLMIGGKNGKIWYYKNVGTLSSPSFSFITNSFGNVNVQGNSNLYGLDGYASPFFYSENDGSVKLLVGSVTGQIYYYSVPSATSICNLINSTVNGFNEGGQSSAFFEDINADGKRDLFIGNASGGLSFFSSMGPDVGLKEVAEEKSKLINLFPNPAKQTINISVEKIEVKKGTVCITDILGKKLFEKVIFSNLESIDVSDLLPGIYFVKIIVSNNLQTVSLVKKLIKE